jgi:hypothetical protein
MIGYDTLTIITFDDLSIGEKDFKIDIDYELTIPSLYTYLYSFAWKKRKYEISQITFEKKTKQIIVEFVE